MKYNAQRGYSFDGLPSDDVELFPISAKGKIKIDGVSYSSIRINRELFNQIKKCFEDMDNK